MTWFSGLGQKALKHPVHPDPVNCIFPMNFGICLVNKGHLFILKNS